MDAEIDRELKEIEERLKPPSVGLLGRTGSGKSSLIKAIFKLDDDEIGADAGFPQTQNYKRYPDPYNPDVPIILYDSPGYEADKTGEFLHETLKFIESKSLSNTQSVDERIHLIWYLIHAGLARLEHFDIQVIETALRLQIPVLVVLTQCDIAKPKELSELKKNLRRTLADISKKLELNSDTEPKIMEVAADPISADKRFGLEELTEESIKVIPGAYSEAFIRAQAVNVKAKRRVAGFIVAAAAGVCLTSAFVPVPGSTPVMIITTQTTLLPSIAEVYNVSRYFDKGFAVASITFAGLIAIAGTTIVDVATTFLSPFFPSLFLVGEAISGATAATYIVAVGLAYISTLEAISIQYLNANVNKDEIEKFFHKRFSSSLKKYLKEVQRESDISTLIKLLKSGQYNLDNLDDDRE